MLRITILAFVGVFSIAHAADRLPVIDMHLHAFPADAQGPPPLAMCTPMKLPAWDQTIPYAAAFMDMMKRPTCDDPVWSPETDEEVLSQTVDAMERHNIVGVLSGTPDRVAEWMSASPDRFLPGIGFQIGGDREYSLQTLRNLHEQGRLAVFAEVVNQYVGIEPNDERMEPYWELAEQLDIPVGIHIGTGPPGVIYLGSPDYRARMHSPLTLEEVLVRHPRLRVYIMHAGFPMLDDLLALMYAHPQVHVEVGVIVHTQPRPAFYRFLRGITDAGYGNRVMFGSDQMVWPGTIERGIQVIEKAPFLSDDEKRDVLYNNAARFLRFTEEDIARHHGM
jgi:predicted TIM-barrel fold metal-dependent hydrolase